MSALDLGVVAAWMVLAMVIGLAVSRRASASSDEFFLAGRSLPWWLAGTSMVATTFAADTPLAVTGLVASGGIAGNWIWWTWGVAHVIAALVFARYWRRLRVVTDAEVMERRYTGRSAAALRVVKAGYMALFLNCLTMGWVILAMRKVSVALFPSWDPLLVTFGLMAMAVFYSTLGGMRSVVLTDIVQFALAMLGAVILAFYALDEPALGGAGLAGLPDALARVYPERAEGLLAFLPIGDLPGMPITLFAVMLTVGWWRLAEGGGYIVQRLGACADAREAERAGTWFAVLHNAIRPWPWILVGLVALVVWPLEAGPCDAGCPVDYTCVEAVCQVPDREATYAMMLTRTLPSGLLGMVVASLLAAFMSTVDTHVNWGASYVVRDVWERFVDPEASPASQVRVGRVAVVAMALIAGLASLGMDSISSVWLFLIMLGSGLGSVSVARWLWWRVNAHAEIAALLASTLLSLGVVVGGSEQLFGMESPLYVAQIPQATRILIVALGSLAAWIPVALFTRPDPPEVLERFYRDARPLGPGWGPVAARCPEVSTAVPGGLVVRPALGLLAVFGSLFGLGGVLLRGPAWGGLAIAGLAAMAWLILRAGQESDA